MLVAVHVSVWTAKKYDKIVSHEVASSHGAHEKAGIYSKHLLYEAEKLEKVKTIASQVRAYVYKVTLPWADEGARILPTEVFDDFYKQMETYKYEFAKAADEFVVDYPRYINDACPLLGSLFNDSDYPASDEIRKKFAIGVEIIPIPSSEDFRVTLSSTQKERIAREIDQNARERFEKATRDLWFRLYEAVRHMAKRLSDEEGRLNSSAIDNVAELVELLPRLNISNDAHLTSIIADVRSQLCQHSAKLLRDNPALRSQTASTAHAIVGKITHAIDSADRIAHLSSLQEETGPTENDSVDERPESDCCLTSLSETIQPLPDHVTSITDKMAAFMGVGAAS